MTQSRRHNDWNLKLLIFYKKLVLAMPVDDNVEASLAVVSYV